MACAKDAGASAGRREWLAAQRGRVERMLAKTPPDEIIVREGLRARLRQIEREERTDDEPERSA